MEVSSKTIQKYEGVSNLNGFDTGHYDVPISKQEKVVRKAIDVFLRLLIALCYTVALFDFMFSPVWLHGYVWTLNQNYTRSDLAEKSGGYMLILQRHLYPRTWNICFSIALIFGTLILLKCLRFRKITIWQIFRVSSVVGILTSLTRCFQEKHRIFPTLHEGFHAYLAVFSICLIVLGVRRSIHLSAQAA